MMHPMRTLSALLLGAALLALTACAGQAAGPASPAAETEDAAKTAAPEASDACTELTELAATLTELNHAFDPNTLLDSARSIDAGLQSLEPPAAVTAEWSQVADIFAAAVSAADAAGSDRAAQESALADTLEAQASPESIEQLDTIATAIGEECGGAAAPAAANDSCTIVSDDDLAAVFGAAVPTPTGTDYGAGFAECEWDAAGTTVLVSILPAADFTEDYLNGEHESVASLEHGTALPDFVGIGRVMSGGTVAQLAGDRAYLVAVATPDENVESALAAAETLAIAASARLAG
jgi:hypothetical protein